MTTSTRYQIGYAVGNYWHEWATTQTLETAFTIERSLLAEGKTTRISIVQESVTHLQPNYPTKNL